MIKYKNNLILTNSYFLFIRFHLVRILAYIKGIGPNHLYRFFTMKEYYAISDVQQLRFITVVNCDDLLIETTTLYLASSKHRHCCNHNIKHL